MSEREDIERALLDSLAEDDDDGSAMPASALVTGLGPGVYDIDMASYLADPCITPSLRSSDIQRILRATPAHVKAFHPRLVDTEAERKLAIRKATKRMDLGNVIHALVLGKGSKFCVIDPSEFNDAKGNPLKGSGKEHKDAVAAAVARGLIVLSEKANKVAQRASERLAAKLSEDFADLGGWPFGEVEQTLIWTEQTKYGPVMCRTRPDILALEFALSGDVKTSGLGLSDDDVQQSMSANRGGMFVQAAWQRRGILANFPEHDGLRQFHAFVETDVPFEPRVIWGSVDSFLTADLRCSRAVEQFALCMSRGQWWAWPPGTIAAAPYLASRWAVEENAWADESAEAV